MSLISAFARQLGEDLEVSGPPGTTISLKLRLRAKTEAESEAEVADEDEAESEAAPDGRDETVAAGPSVNATEVAGATAASLSTNSSGSGVH